MPRRDRGVWRTNAHEPDLRSGHDLKRRMCSSSDKSWERAICSLSGECEFDIGFPDSIEDGIDSAPRNHYQKSYLITGLYIII